MKPQKYKFPNFQISNIFDDEKRITKLEIRNLKLAPRIKKLMHLAASKRDN